MKTRVWAYGFDVKPVSCRTDLGMYYSYTRGAEDLGIWQLLWTGPLSILLLSFSPPESSCSLHTGFTQWPLPLLVVPLFSSWLLTPRLNKLFKPFLAGFSNPDDKQALGMHTGRWAGLRRHDGSMGRLRCSGRNHTQGGWKEIGMQSALKPGARSYIPTPRCKVLRTSGQMWFKPHSYYRDSCFQDTW